MGSAVSSRLLRSPRALRSTAPLGCCQQVGHRGPGPLRGGGGAGASGPRARRAEHSQRAIKGHVPHPPQLHLGKEVLRVLHTSCWAGMEEADVGSGPPIPWAFCTFSGLGLAPSSSTPGSVSLSLAAHREEENWDGRGRWGQGGAQIAQRGQGTRYRVRSEVCKC